VADIFIQKAHVQLLREFDRVVVVDIDTLFPEPLSQWVLLPSWQSVEPFYAAIRERMAMQSPAPSPSPFPSPRPQPTTSPSPAGKKKTKKKKLMPTPSMAKAARLPEGQRTPRLDDAWNATEYFLGPPNRPCATKFCVLVPSLTLEDLEDRSDVPFSSISAQTGTGEPLNGGAYATSGNVETFANMMDLARARLQTWYWSDGAAMGGMYSTAFGIGSYQYGPIPMTGVEHVPDVDRAFLDDTVRSASRGFQQSIVEDAPQFDYDFYYADGDQGMYYYTQALLDARASIVYVPWDHFRRAATSLWCHFWAQWLPWVDEFQSLIGHQDGCWRPWLPMFQLALQRVEDGKVRTVLADSIRREVDLGASQFEEPSRERADWEAFARREEETVDWHARLNETLAHLHATNAIIHHAPYHRARLLAATWNVCSGGVGTAEGGGASPALLALLRPRRPAEDVARAAAALADADGWDRVLATLEYCAAARIIVPPAQQLVNVI
jgi:hypothetical protein